MTLRAILGLLPGRAHIAGGEIVFDGTALSPSSLGALRGDSIGMVFQEPMTALNPVMRVGEQIAEGPRVRLGQSAEKARERALELLRLVGVPDPERRFRAYPHELSGGLRQRIVIAIALACEPQLLLCDEPTTALDVTIQDQILHLLARLRARDRRIDRARDARPRGRRADVRARRRDVRRPHRRDGDRRRGLRRAPPSLHAGAPALRARLRRAARAPRVDRGHASRSRRRRPRAAVSTRAARSRVPTAPPSIRR